MFSIQPRKKYCVQSFLSVSESPDISLKILSYLKTHLDFINYGYISRACHKLIRNTGFISYFYLKNGIQAMSDEVDIRNTNIQKLQTIRSRLLKDEEIMIGLIEQIRGCKGSLPILRGQLRKNSKRQGLEFYLEEEIIAPFRKNQQKLNERFIKAEKEKYYSYISGTVVFLGTLFLFFPILIYLVIKFCYDFFQMIRSRVF